MKPLKEMDRLAPNQRPKIRLIFLSPSQAISIKRNFLAITFRKPCSARANAHVVYIVQGLSLIFSFSSASLSKALKKN